MSLDLMAGSWSEVSSDNKDGFFTKRFGPLLDADKLEMVKSKISSSKMNITIEKAASGAGGNLTLSSGDVVIMRREGAKPGVEEEVTTPFGVKMKVMLSIKENGVQLKETDPNGDASVIDLTVDGDKAKMVHSFKDVAMTMMLQKQ